MMASASRRAVRAAAALALVGIVAVANLTLRSLLPSLSPSGFEFDGEIIGVDDVARRRLAHLPPSKRKAGHKAGNVESNGKPDGKNINDNHARTARALAHRGIDPKSDHYKRALSRRMRGLTQKQRQLSDARKHNRMVRTRLESSRGEPIEGAPADRRLNEGEFSPLTICDRPTDVGSTEDLANLEQHAQCAGVAKDKPLLLLDEESKDTYGRTGNNLLELFHAIQYARDHEIGLGTLYDSWAMDLILRMWMSATTDESEEDGQWQARLERALCLKIFYSKEELEGYQIFKMDTKELFKATSPKPLGEYVSSQTSALRALYREYNTDVSEGDRDPKGRLARDMCSGIDSVFGKRQRKHALYSVVHDRSGLAKENDGHLLKVMAKKSGCDPEAALTMTPEYVKSILRPLGMLNYPVVIITDGMDFAVMRRLLTDPEIGRQVRIVPEEATWVGGDLTLAIMANVFIGNPSSSFSGFIAKSRLALGFGHNYLFRARDGEGNWKTVCGDGCVFDKAIMGPMS